MRAVLFDIGNVLLFFDHGIACRRAAARCGRSPEEVRDMVFASGLEREYDEGRISTGDFIERIRRLLGLRVSDEVIRDIWCDIFRENRPVTELVERLAGSHRLVLLSNTNAMHMAFIRERFPVFRCFHGAALSYEVGHRKPGEAIYAEAIAQAGVPADQCTYVDDVSAYCEAARALGIRSIVYTPDADLSGLLPTH